MRHTNTLTILLASLATAFLATACTGLETGNGGTDDGEVSVKLGLVAADPGVFAGEDADGRAFVVTTAEAYIQSIELMLPPGEHCDDLSNPGQAAELGQAQSCTGRTVRVDGPWTVDLTTGAADPPMSNVRVRPGVYESIEIHMAPSDPVDGQSLVASGRFDDGTGVDKPFRLEASFNDKTRFAGEFTVEPGTTVEALAGLDVTGWFADLPISQCAADGDLDLDGDTVVLEQGKKSCAGIKKTLRDAIEASAFLSPR